MASATAAGRRAKEHQRRPPLVLRRHPGAAMARPPPPRPPVHWADTCSAPDMQHEDTLSASTMCGTPTGYCCPPPRRLGRVWASPSDAKTKQLTARLQGRRRRGGAARARTRALARPSLVPCGLAAVLPLSIMPFSPQWVRAKGRAGQGRAAEASQGKPGQGRAAPASAAAAPGRRTGCKGPWMPRVSCRQREACTKGRGGGGSGGPAAADQRRTSGSSTGGTRRPATRPPPATATRPARPFFTSTRELASWPQDLDPGSDAAGWEVDPGHTTTPRVRHWPAC